MSLPKPLTSSRVGSREGLGPWVMRLGARIELVCVLLLRLDCIDLTVVRVVTLEPSAEHFLQTVSLAPSIVALRGFPSIFDPQTSHIKARRQELVNYEQVIKLVSARILFNSVCIYIRIMKDGSLYRIRSIADYQFGRGVGKVLFPKGVDIRFSTRTQRIRWVLYNSKSLVTLRATDGLFSLTLEGVRRLNRVRPRRYWIEVQDDVAQFIASGRSLFAKHVVACDREIRPGDEVFVVDSLQNILAVGKAVLTGEEMVEFSHGVAARIRHGVSEEMKRVKSDAPKNDGG